MAALSERDRVVASHSRTNQVRVKSSVKNVAVVQSASTEVVDIRGDDPGDLTLIFDNKLI